MGPANLYLWIKHRIATSGLAAPFGRVRRLLQRLRIARRPEFGVIFCEGRYVDDALDRLIGKTANCLDVGAHIGSVSYDLRRRAPDGRLTLIEATPHKARWLTARFPDCTVHNVAVTREPGEVTFYEDRKRPGFSSLTEMPGATPHTVRAARLDDLIDHPVDFIKIDIEGHEYDALCGAEALLRRDMPVILFEAGANSNAMAPTYRRLFELLTDHGYEIHAPVDLAHGRGPLSLETFNLYRSFPFIAFNFFAIPKGAKGMLSNSNA